MTTSVVGHIHRAKMYLVKAHREIDLALMMAEKNLRGSPGPAPARRPKKVA